MPPPFQRWRLEGKRLERSWRAERDAINFINMIVKHRGHRGVARCSEKLAALLQSFELSIAASV